MNKVEIREANINDFKKIQNLNNELFKFEYNKFDNSLKVGWPYQEEGKNYFIDMIENNKVYVAIINNEIIGYLAGQIGVDKPCITRFTAEIDNMYIKNEYRKNGIGKLLIDRFKEYCEEKEVERIIVTAFHGNINAIEFYRKSGFSSYELTLKLDRY